MADLIVHSAPGFLAARSPAGLQGELEALERASGEINPFHGPLLLLPALRRLADDKVRVIEVRAADGRMLGLFPVRLERHASLPFVRVLRSWRHTYCFLCTPLIDRTCMQEVADSLAHWLESANSPAALLELHSYHAAGPFGRDFLPRLVQRPGWVSDGGVGTRALLMRGVAEDSGQSGRHDKELRRLERRMADLGRMDFRVLSPGEDCTPWLERFMELEASGWKGRERTAIGRRSVDRDYFLEVGSISHRSGVLQLLALELDGEPVAMKCNFLAPPGAFAFKIAYDERLARYSPGRLLEKFNMEYFRQHGPALEWMDSCADTGNAMIERLWTGRRQLGWIRLAGRGLAPRVLIRGAAATRRWRRRSRTS